MSLKQYLDAFDYNVVIKERDIISQVEVKLKASKIEEKVEKLLGEFSLDEDEAITYISAMKFPNPVITAELFEKCALAIAQDFIESYTQRKTKIDSEKKSVRSPIIRIVSQPESDIKESKILEICPGHMSGPTCLDRYRPLTARESIMLEKQLEKILFSPANLSFSLEKYKLNKK